MGVIGVAGAEVTDSKPDAELLRDSSFRGGFTLLAPEPGREVACGVVRGHGGGEVVWQLAQWSSRHPFGQATVAAPCDGGGFRFANPARAVSFGDDDGVLALAVNAGEEYGSQPRAQTEPWVHLLVQQAIPAQPRLGGLKALRLHLEAKRVRSRLVRTDGYDPRFHAAQFLCFLTIQNLEKQSPGYGDYLWFGVPVFDSRCRMCRPYSAPDFGGTGKFIHLPAAERFTTGTTHDDDWVTFDADSLPLIREGLAVARSRGYLKEGGDDGGLRVAALNLGWEVTGTFDVEMRVRRLSLVGTGR